MRDKHDIKFLRSVYFDMVMDAKENNETLRKWKFAVNMLDYVLEQKNTFPVEDFAQPILVDARVIKMKGKHEINVIRHNLGLARDRLKQRGKFDGEAFEIMWSVDNYVETALNFLIELEKELL